MVLLKRVMKTYARPGTQRVTALSSINLTVSSGEFVAVTGPSGSGKTTCLLIAGGLLRPDTGKVCIDGRNLYAMTRNELAAFRSQTVGFVFQQYHLIPYLTVLENILAPEAAYERRHNPARPASPQRRSNGSRFLRVVSKLRASKASAYARARALAEQFGLAHRLDHTPGELSAGEKQRTALARALLFSPKVVLADEITGNLDHENTQTVLGFLKEYARTGGSILLVTHDCEIAGQVDRVYHLPDSQTSEAAQ